MNFGIMQGRLSPPVKGHIQEFPDKWKKEFELLEFCGISTVEWLVTKSSFDSNPLFDSGNTLKTLRISSVCADNLVDSRIKEKDFLNKNLRPICLAAIKNNIPSITIPLLEDSDMSNYIFRSEFISNLLPITQEYKEINFSFEAELEMDKLKEIVDLSDNHYVTYDTGNITSCGFSHVEYIDFFKNKINNVHLKDRTWNGQTVPPLTGDTDFYTILESLSRINYSGPYVIQTARGPSGSEILTICNHINCFKGIIERYVIL
jgi:hypothetical protein